MRKAIVRVHYKEDDHTQGWWGNRRGDLKKDTPQSASAPHRKKRVTCMFILVGGNAREKG